MTFDFRKKLFTEIIHKHFSWFDSKDSAPGILSNILSEDITKLNGLTTQTISVIFEAFLTMTIGIIIGLWVSWRIALVATACSPLVFLGGVLLDKLQWQRMGKDNTEDSNKESNALLSDIIMNYRTVVSLGEKNVDFLMNKYENLLELPLVASRKNAHLGGFLFGYS